MRTKIFGGIVVLCVGALLAGGCAKKEIVKSEEPVSPVQVAPPTAPQPVKPLPAEPTPQQAQQPITESPTKEAVVAPESGREAAQQQAATSTNLQNELQKIYFNFDSAALSDEARSALTKNAELVKNNNSIKLRIEGNCDERGSDEYNMALGERRAKAAKDYLVNLGVPANRLTTISYGEEKPAEQGHDEAAWAKNRRDEFVIVK